MVADPCLLCKLCLRNIQSIEPFGKDPLGYRSLCICSHTHLPKLLIKIVQVLGADLAQLQVPDGIVNTGQHFQIPINGGSLHTRSLLQLHDIPGIVAEGAVVVDEVAHFDLFFILCGGYKGFLFHLLLRHALLGRCPQDAVSDGVALVIGAVGNGDAVACDLAVGTPSCFNRWHNVYLPSCK